MRHKMIEALLIVFLLGTLYALSKTETASASGTIYIRENGDVDPPTAEINRAGDVYTLTNNIYETIVIQRDNIIVDGNGYMLQGSGSGAGFDLTNRNNVTLENTYIMQFNYGVSLYESSGNTISHNTLTSNAQQGIFVSNSSNNIISENEVVSNVNGGIFLWLANNTQVNGNNVSYNSGDGISIGYKSFNNTITYNAARFNFDAGISLGWEFSTDNRIVGNNITQNGWTGIYIVWSTVSDNEFYHNNLDNAMQVTSSSANALNAWDNGYPSGGNYWSDYTGLDSDEDGIGDTPYIIDVNNKDNYPFMNPWTPQAHDIAVVELTPSKTIVGKGYTLDIDVIVTNQGIYTQTFDVAIRVNNTNIDAQSVSLVAGSSTTLSFTWDTTGFAKGNYNTSAVTTTVPGEIDMADNICLDGIVTVATPGDVNLDGIVGILDAAGVSAHWYPGPPIGPLGFDPNFDINNDGAVSILDAAIVSAYWTGPPKGPLAE